MRSFPRLVPGLPVGCLSSDGEGRRRTGRESARHGNCAMTGRRMPGKGAFHADKIQGDTFGS